MDKKKFLEQQLDYYYSWIISDKSRSVAIRSWSIAVWLFSIALLLTIEPISQSIFNLLIIVYLPTLLFWLLDGFQNSFIESNEDQARMIEKILVSEEFEGVLLEAYLPISSHLEKTLSAKIKSLLTALFLRETVFIFYFLLLAASSVFIILDAKMSANF